MGRVAIIGAAERAGSAAWCASIRAKAMDWCNTGDRVALVTTPTRARRICTASP